MSTSLNTTRKILVQNRKVRHAYRLLSSFEAGVVLMGSEVKSLRRHQGSLSEAFVSNEQRELFLYNAHIPEYDAAFLKHTPLRIRKLLLHRRQIDKIIGQVTRKGATIVPVCFYLNARGYIKIEIALAEGMKKFDKREALKTREWDKDKQRILKKNLQS